ncbi:CPBP family intramembrane glutamic endopeptidase [Pelosinus sp. UFO1]|uniref:CPBP family intramembrane glutamic endopeptidase n=1 Tax=Pelosinus sp. UFO1 TaxID=484770 RepID=UPI0004D118C0|nr:type II CAAX endopeptidase family protein [Pelosinus sp. UFO1]AIF52970.1 Abortive infection protein [Pelosinus sp. UFO1]
MQNVLHAVGYKQKKETLSLAMYIIAFFTVWSLYVLVAQNFLGQNYPLLFKILSLGPAKLIIWTLPVLLYLKHYDNVNPLIFLRLTDNMKMGVKYIIIVSCFYLLIGLVQQYLLSKHLGFHPNLNINDWVNGIILAGFTEEILFRGFILQKLGALLSFWKANFITALLFLFIHFPGWIHHGKFTFLNIDIVGIFVLGLIVGYVFRKSNSLGACILIHSINNFLSFSL